MGEESGLYEKGSRRSNDEEIEEKKFRETRKKNKGDGDGQTVARGVDLFSVHSDQRRRRGCVRSV